MPQSENWILIAEVMDTLHEPIKHTGYLSCFKW